MPEIDFELHGDATWSHPEDAAVGPTQAQLDAAGLVAVTTYEEIEAAYANGQGPLRTYNASAKDFPPVTSGYVTAPKPAPSTTNPSGFTPPASAPSGYVLAFVDDFTGTSPDETIWGAPYSGNPSSNPQKGKWLPSHLVIADSIANFEMYQDVAGGDPSDANWVGAGIQTRASFTAGRVDVALRVDPCPSVSAIALLYHESSSVSDEIDFVETDPAADGTCTEFWASAHYGTGSAQVQEQKTDTDMADWHVWSVEWDATTISYYCDGAAWATLDNPGVVNPMGFCLQFQTGDYSLTMPPEGAAVAMQVDWVAVSVPET